MSQRISGLALLLMTSMIGMRSFSTASDVHAARRDDAASVSRQQLLEAYGRLPLAFEANRGQADASVQFVARGAGYTVLLTHSGPWLALREPANRPTVDGTIIRMKLYGSAMEPKAVGLDELPGRSHYLIGNDASKWRTNISNYSRVHYNNVWPGIDLIYYGNQRQLEYDFVLEPGADPASIRIAFEGQDTLALDQAGDLQVETRDGRGLRLRKPAAYQDIDGVRRIVASRYVLRSNGQVSVALAPYDTREPLVIDPVLSYSTYLGGFGEEQGTAVAVDASGHAYVTGPTTADFFPTTPGAFDTTFGGFSDFFVTKLDPTGSSLVYSTFLGGSSTEENVTSVAVDTAGSAYVTGRTGINAVSSNFPTTLGAFDTTFNGGLDVFVTKLDPAGSSLEYSTFLGGSGADSSFGIAVDGLGNAYVTGDTSSAGFPTTTGAHDTTFNGGADAFVAKLNPSGSALVYSTFLAGSAVDLGRGIAVDLAGQSYVVGRTTSLDFPTTPGAFDSSFNGVFDNFVVKLGPAGSTLLYSTYLGGSGADADLPKIALDGGDYAHVVGATSSNDFPTTPGAFDTSFNGQVDAFVTKLDFTGSTLLYSTYLGGGGNDQGFGIAIDSSGSAWVTGHTSGGFPTTPDAFDPTDNGDFDVFVSRFNPSGSSLLYSTYLGGSGADFGFAIAIDVADNVFVTGRTRSGQTGSVPFPTTPGAFDTSFNGGPSSEGISDAFVARLGPNGPPSVAASNATVSVNEGQTAANAGSYSDPDSGDDVAISASVGTVTKTGSNAGTWTWSLAATDGPAQSHTVTIFAADGNGAFATTSFALIVNNVPPVIEDVTGPSGPVAVGTPSTVSAEFADAGTFDTHTCRFSWDDGTSTPPSLPAVTVSEAAGAGSCQATHTYAEAGVYTVHVDVTDKDEATATATFTYVVVYDSTAGFVTGGGWILSPAGAYAPDPTLTGRGTFGFVSKYKKGAAIPTGETEFQFHVAGFTFHSDVYEWLVVAGAKAQYKGTGTVNGSAGYQFLLTATDGQQPGGGGIDRFRIKIWNSGGVVYDNGSGSDDIDVANPQAIAGGSIVVHKQ